MVLEVNFLMNVAKKIIKMYFQERFWKEFKKSIYRIKQLYDLNR